MVRQIARLLLLMLSVDILLANQTPAWAQEQCENYPVSAANCQCFYQFIGRAYKNASWAGDWPTGGTESKNGWVNGTYSECGDRFDEMWNALGYMWHSVNACIEYEADYAGSIGNLWWNNSYQGNQEYPLTWSGSIYATNAWDCCGEFDVCN